MKYGINKATLVGNVGDEPKVNEKEGEVLFVTFPFATSDTYKDKEGNEVTTTQWHRVKAWRKGAELIRQYVRKGDSLYIEGKIKTRSWDDKDGVKRYTTEILGDNLTMLGSRRDSDEDTPSPMEDDAPDSDAGEEKDDLPF